MNDGSADPYELERFVVAQESVYARVLAELRSGSKRTHWMWYVFPQIDGLGHSDTSRYYAIRNRQEAGAYLRHPLLGARLVECVETVMSVPGRSASEIFGYPDDMKFHASLTLFVCEAGGDSVFARAIDRFFGGQRHALTLRLLGDEDAT
jgi:uncharacterized protein (DUF1810 family)